MPLVRSPKWAASLLISDGATLSPEALHARLGEVSGLVLAQYNPPKWKPKPDPATPMLWVTGERDAVITLKGSRRSAAYYGADFHVVPGAAHNLMRNPTRRPPPISTGGSPPACCRGPRPQGRCSVTRAKEVVLPWSSSSMVQVQRSPAGR